MSIPEFVSRTDALRVARATAAPVTDIHTIEFETTQPAKWVVTFYASSVDRRARVRPVSRVTVSAYRSDRYRD